MKIVRMNKLEAKPNGKTAAFLDIQTNDEILIKGFKLMDGQNGLFLAVPSQKGKDGKYYDSVVLPKEMKTELEKMAKEQFSKL
jgi:stage V sporulation protein G